MAGPRLAQGGVPGDFPPGFIQIASKPPARTNGRRQRGVSRNSTPPTIACAIPRRGCFTCWNWNRARPRPAWKAFRPTRWICAWKPGRICREADRFLAAKAKAPSPLLAAQLFEQGVEWTGRLEAQRRQIQLRRDRLLAELQAMNAAWKSAPPPDSPARAGALPLGRLEEICRTLGYLARCEGQVQERLAQLSF